MDGLVDDRLDQPVGIAIYPIVDGYASLRVGEIQLHHFAVVIVAVGVRKGLFGGKTLPVPDGIGSSSCTRDPAQATG